MSETNQVAEYRYDERHQDAIQNVGVHKCNHHYRAPFLHEREERDADAFREAACEDGTGIHWMHGNKVEDELRNIQTDADDQCEQCHHCPLIERCVSAC